MILPPVPPGVLRELNDLGGGLVAAREWLDDRLGEGAHCPCCGQKAAVYSRSLTGNMVRILALMARRHGIGRTFSSRDADGTGDLAKLRFWGLVREVTDVRREDAGRAGFWKITPEGGAFLAGRLRVRRRVRVFDNRFLGFEGDAVGIDEVVGTRFDLRELLAGFHYPADPSSRMTKPGPEQTSLEDFLGGEAAA